MSESREDYDYVSMENYTKDTADLVMIGNAVAENLRAELKEMKMLFYGAVRTMGRIEIDEVSIMDEDVEIIRYEDIENNKTIFEVRP